MRSSGVLEPRSRKRSPGMRRVLDRLNTPAMLANDLGEVLAQNPRAPMSPPCISPPPAIPAIPTAEPSLTAF
jgi:hypothetical protein